MMNHGSEMYVKKVKQSYFMLTWNLLRHSAAAFKLIHDIKRLFADKTPRILFYRRLNCSNWCLVCGRSGSFSHLSDVDRWRRSEQISALQFGPSHALNHTLLLRAKQNNPTIQQIKHQQKQKRFSVEQWGHLHQNKTLQLPFKGIKGIIHLKWSWKTWIQHKINFFYAASCFFLFVFLSNFGWISQCKAQRVTFHPKR